MGWGVYGLLRGGGGDGGQWGGGVLLVLRVCGVLVILLLVAALGAQAVEPLPGVAFVRGEEVAKVQGACGFTCEMEGQV